MMGKVILVKIKVSTIYFTKQSVKFCEAELNRVQKA